MMRTELHNLLLKHAGTLEIEYLGKRCAKIKFLGKYKLRYLERDLHKGGFFSYEVNNKSIFPNEFHYKWISDFNCNGIWTTATIKLHPHSKPFYN